MKVREFIKRIEEIVDAPIDIDGVLSLVELYEELASASKPVRAAQHDWTTEDITTLLSFRGTMTTKAIAENMGIPLRVVTNKLYMIDKEIKEIV